MPILGRHQIAVSVAFFGLVMANLFVGSGSLWLMEEKFRGEVWYNQLPHGVIQSQVILVAVWFGLGEVRWYIRLLVAVSLTFLIATAFKVAMRSTTYGHTDPGYEYLDLLVFLFIALMLATSCVGFVLRRTRNWKLTSQAIEYSSATQQFSVADAFLWISILSGALASLRVLEVMGPPFDLLSAALYISLSIAELTVVVLGAMLLAFSNAHQMRGTVLLLLTVIIIGAVFAVPDAYRDIQLVRINAPSAHFLEYLVVWRNHTFRNELFVIAAAITAFINCLALRALGCTLLRPGKMASG
jgi:hypothetical protein